MITRIEFESADGTRTATVVRIEEHHVPPIGVTWWLSRREKGIAKYDPDAYTSRSVAERDARLWVKGPEEVGRG